jgi:hypothetical protein
MRISRCLRARQTYTDPMGPHIRRLSVRNPDLAETDKEVLEPALRSPWYPPMPDDTMRAFATFLVVVLGGYLFFNRSFAYLHVPGVPLYVGEILLATGAVQALRVMPSLRVMLRNSRPLQALLGFMALGGALTAFYLPTWGLDAARDAALWYYAAFAFLVVLALRRGSVEVADFAGLYAWVIPVFLLWGPVAIAVDNLLSLPSMPDSHVTWLAHKPGDVAVHAAAGIAFLWLCREHTGRLSLRAAQLLTGVGLATILVAGSINRGGLITAMLILAATVLIAPHRRTALATAVTTGLLLIAFLAASGLEVHVGHRPLSLEQLHHNIASVFADDAERDGTIRWRMDFWEEVGSDTLSGENGLFGLGFGVNVAHLYDIGSDPAQPLRNSHNSHMTVLARMGVPGAALWLAFWTVWFFHVIRVARRRSVQDGRGALAAWVAIAVGGILVNAIFDPTLEGPHVAVWLWSLVGLGCWLALPEGRQGTVRHRGALTARR